MKKIVRLTEQDLVRLVKKVINEQSLINLSGKETDSKKTDSRTNPYWKQLESKLLALGFTKKEDHIVNKAAKFNMFGYPNVDFYRCTMSNRSGIEVIYPFYSADYTGDYYPEFVEVNGIPKERIKNPSCVGSPPNEDMPHLKVKCIDYITQLVSSSIKK